MSRAGTPASRPARHRSEPHSPDALRRRSRRDAQALDRYEQVAVVADLFCRGMSVGAIAEAVNMRYNGQLGRPMSREAPYRLLRFAAQHGMMRFRAPEHVSFAEQVVTHYPWLERKAHVVRTTRIADVAYHGAELVRGRIQQLVRRDRRRAVHIGLGGGCTMREFARNLADLLCEPADDLPETLVIHSLVAGADPNDPTTVPSAFCAYFQRGAVMQVQPEFVSFNAPAVVHQRELPALLRRREIREARARVGELDLLVTTGADCVAHSALRARMAESPRSLRKLEKSGWVGDMMWRPLGARQRIEVRTEIRAMTLIDLEQVAEMRAAGKQVVLLLGCCPDCQAPRQRILRAILDQREPLITHLVADSRTA
ncbi:MAG: hypothetical protein GF330_13520, partial [Candidatus Eisenbacteria bacterium]|nr:hypothetical protein [Candidatus Eisenbacteria bacterium]